MDDRTDAALRAVLNDRCDTVIQDLHDELRRERAAHAHTQAKYETMRNMIHCVMNDLYWTWCDMPGAGDFPGTCGLLFGPPSSEGGQAFVRGAAYTWFKWIPRDDPDDSDQ